MEAAKKHREFERAWAELHPYLTKIGVLAHCRITSKKGGGVTSLQVTDEDRNKIFEVFEKVMKVADLAQPMTSQPAANNGNLLAPLASA